MQCCVENCNNDNTEVSRSRGITFHTLPEDDKKRSLWISSLGLEQWYEKEDTLICSVHFKEHDFFYNESGMKKVSSDAVPMLEQNPEDLELPITYCLCKICLSHDRKVYDLKLVNLENVYIQLTGITLEESRLPRVLCWECCHRLKSMEVFRKKALLSHTLLTNTFNSNSIITVKDVAFLNKQQIKSRLIQTVCAPADFDSEVFTEHTVKVETSDEQDCTQNDETISNEVEIKHERNEIFFQDVDSTVNDNFEVGIEKSDSVCDDSEMIDEKDDKDNSDSEIDDIKNEKDDKDNSDSDIDDNKNDKVDDNFELDDKNSMVCDNVEIVVAKNDTENDKSKSNDDKKDTIDDDLDSDDDKKLSEIKIKNTKIKTKTKTKQPRKRAVKKKIQKKEKSLKEDPNEAMARYRKDHVKRRRDNKTKYDLSIFTVKSLTYDEQIKEIEQRQENPVFKSSRFKCNVCYRGFNRKVLYDIHAAKHNEKCGSYECFICKTRMTTANNMRKHLTAMHTEKYCCTKCPFVTRNRGVARDHERFHEGIKHKCPHCELEFDKVSTYLGHIRIKHASDVVCALCGLTFMSQKGIEVHKHKKHKLDTEVVPENGPYCELCDVRFISDIAYDRHFKVSTKHTVESDPGRIRNDSKSIYVGDRARCTERRPVTNKDTTQKSDKIIVTCEQCGIKVNGTRLYAQHFRRVHPDKNRTKFPTLKKPSMCDQCGRILPSYAQLKDHMEAHTGENKFTCSKCPKSFNKKSNLLMHEKIHSSTKKSYECPICGKHFSFFNNRTRHMLIHTGLKPHKCESCDKSFTTQGQLRAHVDHVHMKKPWPKRSRRRDDTSHDKFTED